MSVEALSRPVAPPTAPGTSDARRRLLQSLLTDHRQARLDQITALELADPRESDLDPGARLRALHGARANLAEIHAALLRVDTAQFGSCAGCGSPVPDERLLAVPWTRHCVRCAVAARTRFHR